MAEVSDHMVCSICLDRFTKPKIIDCHHSFCKTCLDDFIRKNLLNGYIKCPLCRQDIKVPANGASGFASNFYIKDECNSNFRQCEVCNNQEAIFICTDCDQFICILCKTTHDAFTICKNHTVLNLHVHTDVVKKRKRFCLKHTSEELDFYCRECCVSICIKCLMSNHKEHTTSDVRDCGSEFRQELEKTKLDLEEIVDKMKQQNILIEKTIIEMKTHTMNACKDVDYQVNKICKVFRERGGQLKNEIKNSFDRNESKLKCSLKNGQEIVYGLKATCQHASQLLAGVQCTVDIIDSLPGITKKKTTHTNFAIPEYKIARFQPGKINNARIFEQLGEWWTVTPDILPTRSATDILPTHSATDILPTHSATDILPTHSATETIKPEQENRGCSPTPVMEHRFNIKELLKTYRMYSNRKRIHGVDWFIGVRIVDASLYFYLNIDMSKNSRMDSCSATFTLKLVNRKNHLASLSIKQKYIFEGSTNFLWSNVISIVSLMNTSNGFIDSSENFIIKVQFDTFYIVKK